MKVKRLNCDQNTITTFLFEPDTYEEEMVVNVFAVKNFTSGNILACIGDFDEGKAVKIPAMFAEKIFDNFCEDITRYTTKSSNRVTIKAEEGGEVEVRCIE